MTRIADLARQALALRSQRRDALAAIKDDPDATTVANAYYRETQTRAIETRYAEQMATIREQATQAAADAKTAAAPHFAFDATNTAALIRSEQAWTHVVRPQLEKGRTLDQALAGADADAVHGAARFAAPYLAAQATTGSGVFAEEGTDPATYVHTAVAGRMAGLKPEHADKIIAGAHAEAHLEAFRSVVVAAERGDDLGAALTVAYSFGTQRCDVNTTVDTAQGP